MNTSFSLRSIFLVSAYASIALSAQAEKPNILFIVAEDASLDFGCYGNRIVHTPHTDQAILKFKSVRLIFFYILRIISELWSSSVFLTGH